MDEMTTNEQAEYNEWLDSLEGLDLAAQLDDESYLAALGYCDRAYDLDAFIYGKE